MIDIAFRSLWSFRSPGVSLSLALGLHIRPFTKKIVRGTPITVLHLFSANRTFCCCHVTKSTISQASFRRQPPAEAPIVLVALAILAAAAPVIFFAPPLVALATNPSMDVMTSSTRLTQLCTSQQRDKRKRNINLHLKICKYAYSHGLICIRCLFIAFLWLYAHKRGMRVASSVIYNHYNKLL
jgi:hypothetical protein